jgi:hypothetical protein
MSIKKLNPYIAFDGTPEKAMDFSPPGGAPVVTVTGNSRSTSTMWRT